MTVVPSESPLGESETTPDESAVGGEGSAFGQTAARPGDPFNPYAAPSTPTGVDQEGTVAELKPTKTSTSEILTTAWETFRDNLMQFFLLGLVMMAIYIGGYVVGLVFTVPAALVGPNNTALFWTLQGLNIIWAQIYGTLMSAVGIRYSLSVTAGNQEPMQGAFNVLPYFLRLLFSQILVGLMIYAAMLVCLLPLALLIPMNDSPVKYIGIGIVVLLAVAAVIYVLARMCLASTFILDRNQGIIEGISSSAAYTKGNALAIFLAGLVIFIVMMFVTVFTCGLGLVIMLPFQFMTIVLIYRLTTGQGTGGQSPFAQE
jgi:hypothetical protein